MTLGTLRKEMDLKDHKTSHKKTNVYIRGKFLKKL